jgi:mannose-6-phosphate isomerase-like protein (cupin superfamily)
MEEVNLKPDFGKIHLKTAAELAENYRKVVWTDNMQIVLMYLQSNEIIDKEKHENADQAFFILKGSATFTVFDQKGESSRESLVGDPGDMVVVGKDTYHEVKAGPFGCKVMTIYSSPQHKPGTGMYTAFNGCGE